MMENIVMEEPEKASDVELDPDALLLNEDEVQDDAEGDVE